MKKALGFLAAAVVVLMAGSAVAANAVNVTGDLANDGNLMIDVNWTVDTAKYRGDTPDAVRKQVFEDIWKQTLPQLVKKTKGHPVSFEKANFSKLSEQKQLVETRADGTKVFAYSAKVKYTCPMQQGAATASSEKEVKNNLEEQSHYRFVREGID